MAVSIAIAILVICLIIGIPVAFSFLISTLYLILTQDYDPSFLLPYGYSKMGNIVLLAIPLFILAGGIMEKGGIGGKLVDFVDVLIGRIKGGLGAVAVVSCAIFGSITGSAAATLSCIGSIMFPRLQAKGYPVGYSAALLANASVLGLLIPPSAIMILYAWVGNQSVLASFLATVVPGLILMTLLCLVNYFLLRKNPNIQMSDPVPLPELAGQLRKKSWSALPALAMPFLILGGIYAGIITPTEAAAVAVLYAIPVGFFIYKGLNWRNLKEVLIESATTTGVIMVMLFAVMILCRLYIMEDLPNTMLEVLSAISPNKYVILLMINLLLIGLGMIMDDVSAVLIATPIFLPVAISIGVDPIHFAAILAVNLGMGNITPPTAPLLYLGGRLGKAPINQMLMPTLYMLLFAWIPTLVIVTLIPEVALFLPQLILQK